MNKGTKNNTTADLFKNDGEIADLIRDTAWSRTALGPIEEWPQSLRTSVSICLQSRFPIIIWWGGELSLIYNEAYIPILGGKHPKAFARPGLSKHAWGDRDIKAVIEPMLRSVMDTGEATWSEDELLILERNGFPEETYFTWSYSPIRVEDGKVGGVFTAVTETTEKVIGQRRLKILHDLAEQSLKAKNINQAFSNAASILTDNRHDAPFFLLYSIDPDSDTAGLVCHSEMDNSSVAPRHIALHGNLETEWPLDKVIRGEQEVFVQNLAARFGKIPKGPWPETPHSALMMPIFRPGQKIPYGVVIVGLSPRLPFDVSYKSFIRLLSDQIATAISHVLAYEEERKRAETLAEIDHLKTVFFSNVSHEFRTPLTLILGPVHDLLDEETSPVQRRRLRMVERNGHKLQKLVNTLLDFSRIEAGRIDARYTPTDICSYTGDLVSNFRSAMEKAGLQLIVNCEHLSEPVYIDRDMWEKIIFNLLSNALKFTFQGKVEVSVRENRHDCIVSITDTGEGIPEKDLPDIFDRFKRVEGAKSRSHDGSGIGLSLVKELVNLHKGSVEVSSRIGQGTTFTIRIPKGKEHLPKERLQAEPAVAGRSIGARPYLREAGQWLETDAMDTVVDNEEAVHLLPGYAEKPKIVLADDNADMRRYVKNLLGDKFEVFAGSNGKKALELIDNYAPDLVITDVMMPVMDGFELLKRLKSQPVTSGIPVIMLSARAGSEATVEGIHGGADDYLVKPFSSSELIARVSTLIAANRSRREAQAQLYELFMQAPALIGVLKGREGICELFNPLFSALWGNRNVLGKPMREAWPEMEGQGWFEAVEQVFDTGKSLALNEKPVRADWNNDGDIVERYFNCIYTPYFNLNRQVSGVMIFGFEVTDMVTTRKKIQDSESYYRMLTDNTPVMTRITRPDGSCSYLNKKWYVYTGQTPDTGLGFGWLQAIHPEDSERTGNLFSKFNESHSSFNLEYRLRSKHGKYRWHLDSGLPKFNAEGKFEGFIGSVIDIHDRKLAEEKLWYHATIFQNIADAVIGTDLNYIIISWNKGAEKLYDWKEKEVIGHEINEIIHTQAENSVLNDWDKKLHEYGFWQGEVRQKKRNGTKIPVMSSVTFIKNNYGENIGVVVVNRDITERKRTEDAQKHFAEQLEAKVKKRTEELERSNQDLQQFAHVASHDLKEPIRKIKTFANFLQAEYSALLPHKAQMFLQKIHSAADRTRYMIDGVLAYSSLNASDQPITKVNLKATLEDIKHDLEVMISQKGAIIVCRNLPVIEGADVLLHQLFYNLILNGLKFSKPERPPKITLTGGVSLAGQVIIRVKDNGIGFEPGEAERIFNTFTRLHSKDAYEGTGLGLALCKKIVERHGGSILADGEVNKGAEFTIILPLKQNKEFI